MTNMLNQLRKTRFMACLFIVILSSCKNDGKQSQDNYKVISKEQPELGKDYQDKLKQIVILLATIEEDTIVTNQQENYKKARTLFKNVEPYLAFADVNNYKSLNAPNILKVEEEDATNIKIQNPFGFQVIEENVFADKVNQKKLKAIVEKTKSRINLMANNSQLLLKDYHLIWLLRNQIARTALTGITGFDSPVLEQSLSEAKDVYNTIKFIIETNKNKFKNKNLYNQWINEITQTKQSLQGDFNAFNRYSFIKNHSHKQLELLVKTAKDWNVEYPFTMAFNNEGTSLFSKETFNIDFFSDPAFKNEYFEEKASLGKQLFNDKKLSKNETMSCATCHQSDKALTDGLITFPKQKRNTPTLTYASLQKAFFHDGRSGSLEGQVVSVVSNPDEFHSDLNDLVEVAKNNKQYTDEFQKLYGKVNDMVIRNAIATYIKTFNKFNSKFDENINGKENTLTTDEINGFNLFTGKGKCATCHFPPVFNGTVPPNYSDTELEALGTPSLKKTALSEDLGRYELFKTEERKHFFKTPTVRNVEKTAPYMHNGTYKTLAEVVDFYNKGGGIGLGFELEHQTLPFDKLDLTEKEIADIIAFMKTLSDR